MMFPVNEINAVASGSQGTSAATDVIKKKNPTE